MTLPTVHWVPLLPPDRDDPPHEAMLVNGVSFCPELDAVLVARWRLVRKVLANEREFASSGDRPRAVLARAFGPDRVGARAQRLRRFADVLVDRLRPVGRADLEAGFAAPFVTRALNDVIGFPAADDDLVATFRHPTEVDGGMDTDRAHRYVSRLAAGHRFTGPDLIGDLVDGGLATAEIARLTLAGLASAEQATRDLVLFAVRDMLATGRHHVEESLRRWSPHGMVLRRTTTAVTVSGCRLPAGTRVGLVLAAANLDPAVFPRPREFDPARPWLERHLAFGHGVHRCRGAVLARTAAGIAIEALSRLPNPRLADPGRSRRKAHPFLNGPDRVDIAWG